MRKHLAAKYVDKEVVFGIRPEQISNEPRADSAMTPVTLKVEIAEPMGVRVAGVSEDRCG